MHQQPLRVQEAEDTRPGSEQLRSAATRHVRALATAGPQPVIQLLLFGPRESLGALRDTWPDQEAEEIESQQKQVRTDP